MSTSPRMMHIGVSRQRVLQSGSGGRFVSCKFSAVRHGHTANLRQVEVDLALNAHANARWHHELRKKHLGKLQKTVDANAKAFKAAEKRTNTQLVQVPAGRSEHAHFPPSVGRRHAGRAVLDSHYVLGPGSHAWPYQAASRWHPRSMLVQYTRRLHGTCTVLHDEENHHLSIV